MEKTFSAPLAAIEIGGVRVGLIRNLTFTENVQRGEVQGLGSVVLQEVPIVALRCTFTAESYLINLKKFGTIKDPFWPSDATDPKTLINTLLLGEKPVSIHVYRKTAGNVDTSSGLVLSEGAFERIGVASDCYLDSKTWNISEQSIGGKNISGRYLTPIFLT
jgi:hypothetical protein